MNIVDKFQAKRLGVSEKRYNEADKIAQTIWKNLISEGKIINPFMHIRMPKSLMFIQLIFIIAMIDCKFRKNGTTVPLRRSGHFVLNGVLLLN